MAREHNIPLLRLGCRDWEAPDLIERYYPEDLPADWRLAYYANEAECVLLEPQRWRVADPEDIAGWVAEVGSRFRFYLEAADSLPGERLTAALGEHLGGVVALGGGKASTDNVLLPTDAPEGTAWAAGERAVLCVEDRDMGLREWRLRVEALGHWLARWAEVAVILEGATATPRKARELRVLAELLGLA